MLKDIRRKVMQIANRLVGQGYIRANAMATAWKLVRYRALKAKVSGTSFDNRSVTRQDNLLTAASTIPFTKIMLLSYTVVQ